MDIVSLLKSENKTQNVTGPDRYTVPRTRTQKKTDNRHNVTPD